MKTTTVEVTQYLLPDGRQKRFTTELPADSEAAYGDMLARGCRLEAEVMLTGEVSLAVVNPSEQRDVDNEVVFNGPAVQVALVAMLAREAWTQVSTD